MPVIQRSLRIIRQLVCLGYWVLLTVLLLSPDPAAIVHYRPGVTVGVHFTAFLVLTLLAHAARWPKPPGWPVAALVVYAIGSELLQHFVPPRTVSGRDVLENLAAVAVGSLIYWGVQRARQQRAAAARP